MFYQLYSFSKLDLSKFKPIASLDFDESLKLGNPGKINGYVIIIKFYGYVIICNYTDILHCKMPWQSLIFHIP